MGTKAEAVCEVFTSEDGKQDDVDSQPHTATECYDTANMQLLYYLRCLNINRFMVLLSTFC